MSNKEVFDAKIHRYRELYRLCNGVNYNGKIVYEMGFVVYVKDQKKVRLKRFIENMKTLEKRYRRKKGEFNHTLNYINK